MSGARLHLSKIVFVRETRRCFGVACGKEFPKGTKMLSQKYFPERHNKCHYSGLVAPTTIHVCVDCITSPVLKALWEAHK